MAGRHKGFSPNIIGDTARLSNILLWRDLESGQSRRARQETNRSLWATCECQKLAAAGTASGNYTLLISLAAAGVIHHDSVNLTVTGP
jgi:hypothetical protein